MKIQRLAAAQLLLLSACHFFADMLAGTLPGFLPALRSEYSLSLVFGTVLLTVSAFSSNGIQLYSGTLRRHAARPLFIPIGIALGCAVCFIFLVPKTNSKIILTAVVLVLGAGNAILHPEGLRAVCGIPIVRIPAEFSTPIFMLSGFSGFAVGPLVSGVLVETFGFPGLLFLLIPAALLILWFRKLRPRLASDSPASEPSSEAAPPEEKPAVSPVPPFAYLFLIACLINSGCAVMQGLLPTYLHTFGYSLKMGGFAAMLFGFGAGFGALFTGALSRKLALLKILRAQVFLGIPAISLYFLYSDRTWALWLLPFCGILLGSGFPNLVVLARKTKSALPLGARMGLLVGGTWVIASSFLLVTGWLGDHFSLRAAMFLIPAFFLALLGILAFRPPRTEAASSSVQ